MVSSLSSSKISGKEFFYLRYFLKLQYGIKNIQLNRKIYDGNSVVGKSLCVSNCFNFFLSVKSFYIPKLSLSLYL